MAEFARHPRPLRVYECVVEDGKVLVGPQKEPPAQGRERTAAGVRGCAHPRARTPTESSAQCRLSDLRPGDIVLVHSRREQ